ncbi:hypothetical protein BU23DRAFT_565484 [Bimuria novae-zelandiae CBS 107.79]|uniref:Uncharacterized protein n=1 Tax=Bimuria novae-zelandiae CBS 107.79 TaxID=1447943 RepID=A0A6A5VPI9_9PLEO|nr:hypothetical protein BU23DRAFT_565484 [Bimuria novae-zelandiae CBS 107.79]
MLPLLASIAQHGWRETFRTVRDPDNVIKKLPPSPRKEYAQIQRRENKGRKTRTTAYQLIDAYDGERTYRRISNGSKGYKDDREALFVRETLVVRKKSVAKEEEKGQRERRREGRDMKRKSRSRSILLPPKAGNSRHRGGEDDPVETRRSSRFNHRADTASVRRDVRPNSDAGESVYEDHEGREDGIQSPFSQPDMDVRGSHAFVFGDDINTSSHPQDSGNSKSERCR